MWVKGGNFGGETDPSGLPMFPPQGQRITPPCGLLKTIKQCWPRTQGGVWGEKGHADLVLGILVGVLKRKNRHRGGTCNGLIPFSQGTCLGFQTSLSACGSQTTISLKLLLCTRSSPFDISQTCQTSEGPMVIPSFHPAARVVLTHQALALTVCYTLMAFLQIQSQSYPCLAVNLNANSLKWAL